jgi:hypothetical protein
MKEQGGLIKTISYLLSMLHFKIELVCVQEENLDHYFINLLVHLSPPLCHRCLR